MKWLKRLFVTMFLLGTCGAVLIWYGLNEIEQELPSWSGIKDYHPPVMTKLYDKNGVVYANLYKERRTVIPRKEIPDRLANAFIAAEDSSFYSNNGIAVTGVAAAAFQEAKRRAHLIWPVIPGGAKRGGSTITQQLVKTFLLTPEKTYKRKIKEMVLAYQIGQVLTKDEILYLYLNQIYFGNGAYGVEEASLTYFGKHVGQLTLAECATLASAPKSPNEINPIANPERTLERRTYVLDQMEKNGFVKPDEVALAKKEPLPARRALGELQNQAPYFAEEVRRELIKKYGEKQVYEEGLLVRTTVDLRANRAAQQALTEGLALVDKRNGRASGTQGALVAINTDTRGVVALVGGTRFDSGFNRATQAVRQPGSSFKPFIYAAGIASKQFTAASMLMDTPMVFTDPWTKAEWKPQNSDGKFRGEIRLRECLTFSVNTCSVSLVMALTPQKVIEVAKNVGLGDKWPKNLSLALGTGEVTPFQLATAYATFADQGRYAKSVLITKVSRLDGTVLEESKVEKTQVMDPAVAYVTLSMMKSVVEQGTAQKVKELGRPVAGKTGTTQEAREAWFAGCVPGLCTVVYVGIDNHDPLGKDEYGGKAAAPVWINFNKVALEGVPVTDFAEPRGVVTQYVDAVTGEPALEEDDTSYEEVFLAGVTVPTVVNPDEP